VRILAILLAVILVGLQAPLWFGKGGWLRVRELQKQVAEQKAATAKLDARTKAFEAEVSDLKTGTEALEERARSDLGMTKQDEIYFQLAPAGSTLPAPAPTATPAAAGR
jgi:cell division protein FtsB